MDPKVTELYNDYIHGDMPRRSFLKQLAVITGGASMANAVLASITTRARRVMTKPPQACHGKEP